jgi:hypothetical protein
MSGRFAGNTESALRSVHFRYRNHGTNGKKTYAPAEHQPPSLTRCERGQNHTWYKSVKASPTSGRAKARRGRHSVWASAVMKPGQLERQIKSGRGYRND